MAPIVCMYSPQSFYEMLFMIILLKTDIHGLVKKTNV